jgi:ubiquitin C-terminal hydrolase
MEIAGKRWSTSSAVLHFGASAYHGHYIAVERTDTAGHWTVHEDDRRPQIRSLTEREASSTYLWLLEKKEDVATPQAAIQKQGIQMITKK